MTTGCMAWQLVQRCDENCKRTVSPVTEKRASTAKEDTAFMLPSVEVGGGKRGQWGRGELPCRWLWPRSFGACKPRFDHCRPRLRRGARAVPVAALWGSICSDFENVTRSIRLRGRWEGLLANSFQKLSRSNFHSPLALGETFAVGCGNPPSVEASGPERRSRAHAKAEGMVIGEAPGAGLLPAGGSFSRSCFELFSAERIAGWSQSVEGTSVVESGGEGGALMLSER